LLSRLEPQHIAALGKQIRDNVSYGSSLAEAAIDFAICGNTNIALELAGKAEAACYSRDADDNYKLDTLLSCAKARNYSGDQKNASDLLLQAEQLISGIIDTRKQERAFIEVAQGWSKAGNKSKALENVLRTVPVGLKGSYEIQRIQSLMERSLKRDAPSSNTGPQESLRQRSVFPPRNSYGYSISSDRDSQEKVYVATRLIARAEFSEALKVIDKIERNNDRANMLNVLAHEMAGVATDSEAISILEKILASSQSLWAREEVSRIQAVASLTFLRLRRFERACEVARQIEYNDLRVCAIAILMRQLRFMNEPALLLERADQIEAVLEGLWAQVEVLKGAIFLASGFAWAGDHHRAKMLLKRAQQTTVPVAFERKEKRNPYLFPDIIFQSRFHSDSYYLEEALLDLVEMGYGADSLELWTRLKREINLEEFLKPVGRFALTSGDDFMYERVLSLALDFEPETPYERWPTQAKKIPLDKVIPQPPQHISTENRLLWLSTAFRALRTHGQKIVWDHISAFAPLLLALDDHMVEKLALCVKEVEDLLSINQIK
jgi:hypothetical protein